MIKILIPVEDKKYGKAQIDFISKHELPEDARFTLMTTIKPLAVQDYGFAVPHAYFETIVKEDEKLATSLLNELEAELARRFPKAKIERLIEFGSPAQEILREAKDENYDWIILGSHGRSGLDKFFLGSVSQAVVNHAHCSVTVVRLAPGTETESNKVKEASSSKA